MGVLHETRDKFAYICRQREVDAETPVTVRRLSTAEPPFCRGTEVVIEATVGDTRGQAIAHDAADWTGTLGDVFAMSLDVAGSRAMVVATLNALAVKLGIVERIILCRQHDPLRCGPELVNRLFARFADVRKVFVVGLQPAVVEALVDRLGADNVRVVDHDAEDIGQLHSGVRVGDGAADISKDVAWCELMLVTGESVVDGTLDELLTISHDASKPLVFFGNTIAAVAAVAELERVCPLGLN